MAGYGSDSEVGDEAAHVSLPTDLGRVNRSTNKSAVKLHEIGPRMMLQLVRIEEGLCFGGIIFSEFGETVSSKNQKSQKEGDLNEDEKEEDDDEEAEDDDEDDEQEELDDEE